ncbi:MAG TPA: type II secretion system F family protein [bacterium]|nr:type II secretion system F family protein [bacterium]
MNTPSDLIILDTPQSGGVAKRQSKIPTDLGAINEWLMKQQKIKVAQKVIFFRLLATMANAGLPMLKSIAILQKQEKDPILQILYKTIQSDIKGGKNLSQSMRAYRGNFSDSECSIIESGEKTGKLNGALIQLADQVEKISSTSKKLKGALIYPVAIIFVMFGAVGVLMTLVVPKIVEIFGDKTKLPPLTKALIAVSDFFVGYWWAMILGVVAFILFVSIWKRTKNGHYRYDGIMLRIPIFGNVIRKVILSRFARVFSNLLSSGISILESLRIIADVVGNEVYKQRFLLLREDIKKGVKIGESLQDDRLFPEMLVQMIKVGEETAKLDSIILKIADFYDEEVETVINSIQKLLEPIIIVTMAIVIGLIAVGIMQPIMNMADIVSEG